MKFFALILLIFGVSFLETQAQPPNDCDFCPGGSCTQWTIPPPLFRGIDGCNLYIHYKTRTCTCNGVQRKEFEIYSIVVTDVHCEKNQTQMEALFKEAVSEVIYYTTMVDYGSSQVPVDFQIIFRVQPCWKYIFEDVQDPHPKRLARSMEPCGAATHNMYCCEWLMNIHYDPNFTPNVTLNNTQNTPPYYPPDYCDILSVPPYTCKWWCDQYPPNGAMPLPISMSVEEVESSIKYSIFPNVTTNSIEITLNGEINGQVGFHVFNSTGQMIMERQFDKNQSQQKFFMDMSGLASGLYNILMIMPNGIVVNGAVLITK